MLVDQARPGSVVRNEAVELMGEMGTKLGPSAPYYARLLKASGDPKYTPELLDLAEKMPDLQGQSYAFDELMKLTSGNPISQRSMVTILMDRAPNLTAHALNYLTQQNIPISDMVDTGTVRQLSRGHNMEAVRPLLKIAAERPDLAPAANRVLEKFPSNLTRYFKNEFKTMEMHQGPASNAPNFYERQIAATRSNLRAPAVNPDGTSGRGGLSSGAA
ncbi:MAG: hypothetical protein ACRD3W_15785, partial [Terriglobales bacterium]